MRRRFVSSSSILSIGYDAESMTLEIAFNNGMVYQYFGVPESEYAALMQAESKGAYFNTHIREQFSWVRR